MILVPLLQFGVLFSLAVSSQEGPAVYTPQGKKDPFEPRNREQHDTVETPLTAPLRQLAISELVIVGTAVGKLGGFALVQGADRLTHLAPTKARFADGHLAGDFGRLGDFPGRWERHGPVLGHEANSIRRGVSENMPIGPRLRRRCVALLWILAAATTTRGWGQEVPEVPRPAAADGIHETGRRLPGGFLSHRR